MIDLNKCAELALNNAIHGTNFNTKDIKNTHGIDLGIERRNEFTYLLTYLLTPFLVPICQ